MTARERPILFSAPMVRAILGGRKTQTRRVVKPQPYIAHTADDGMRFWNVSGAVGGRISLEPDFLANCPYGMPGDHLWVRESTRTVGDGGSPDADSSTWCEIEYLADGVLATFELRDIGTFSTSTRARPSIHMPRWASRITLEITDVRVERLQALSRADAAAEGICYPDCEPKPPWYRGSNWPEENFAALWDSLNAARGFAWNSNPWVWALTFREVGPW